MPTIASSQELAKKCADFFTDKIAKIRESFDNSASDNSDNSDIFDDIQNVPK